MRQQQQQDESTDARRLDNRTASIEPPPSPPPHKQPETNDDIPSGGPAEEPPQQRVDDDTKPPPVYRQYILDRVSGYSYVPREARPGQAPTTTTAATPVKQQEEEEEEEEEQQQQQEAAAAAAAVSDGPGPIHDRPCLWNVFCCLVPCLDETQEAPPHCLCRVPPCVARYPGLLEQNACCRRLGQVGWHECFKTHHVRRRRLFSIGLFFNIIALALTICASLAGFKDYDLLTRTSFARGHAVVQNSTTSSQTSTRTVLTLNIGFRAIAVDDPYSIVGGNQVLLFDTYCDNDNLGLGDNGLALRDELEHGICGDCVQSSRGFILACLFNIVVICRNILSDFTRMYPKYDLNCPNLMGSLMSTLSVFLGLFTIFTYQERCLFNIDAEVVGTNFTSRDDSTNTTLESSSSPGLFESSTTTTGEDPLPLVVTFDWWRGPGLTYLGIATVLRLVDALCNYIVPTPTITRNRHEQADYEQTYGPVPTTCVEEEQDDDDDNEPQPDNDGGDNNHHQDPPDHNSLAVEEGLEPNDHRTLTAPESSL